MLAIMEKKLKVKEMGLESGLAKNGILPMMESLSLVFKNIKLEANFKLMLALIKAVLLLEEEM